MKFGIFLFDGAEPIDLATVGVLSMARRLDPTITYCTIAPQPGLVRLANGLAVVADHGFEDAPAVDVLVVTGGATWVVQAKSAATLDFLRSRAPTTTVASICTGGMIVAAAGLLDGRSATTRSEGVANEVSPLTRMKDAHPTIDVVHRLVVDEGSVVTGGGVCLCIDMMLHLIETRMSAALADDLARLLEYGRARAVNRQALGELVVRPKDPRPVEARA